MSIGSFIGAEIGSAQPLTLSTFDAAGVVTGVATVAGVGEQIQSAGAFSSTGISTTSGIGASEADAVFASAGVATTSFVGGSEADSVFASAGTSTTAGVGVGTPTATVFAATGIAVVSGVGESDFEAAFSSAGVAEGLGDSTNTVEIVGSSAGVATTSGVGEQIQSAGAFSSVGTSAITGISAAFSHVVTDTDTLQLPVDVVLAHTQNEKRRQRLTQPGQMTRGMMSKIFNE